VNNVNLSKLKGRLDPYGIEKRKKINEVYTLLFDHKKGLGPVQSSKTFMAMNNSNRILWV